MSYRDNSISGYIIIDNEFYCISPLNRIIRQADSDQYIVFKDLRILDNSLLLHDEIVNPSAVSSDLKSLNYSNPVKLLRIATDADYEFYADHGSDTNADILEIINLVEGIYESTFNVTFEVVYQNYYSSSNDPYTVAFSLSTGSDFLAEFRSYWIANHSSVYRDVAHLFTGKSRDSIAGIGYTPAIYPNSTFAYSCTSNGSLMHKIMAHELGHNFDGKHSDGENCNLISASLMCPELKSGTPYYSSNSITTIGSYINNTADLITYSYYDGVVCSSGRNFSISNIPTGYTVTWPKRTNLEFSGSSTGSLVTIIATSYGEGWVEPTLTRGGVSINFSKDYFWVGKPDFYISGDYQLSTYELGVASILTTNENLELQEVTNYDWSYVGPLSSFVGGTVLAHYRAASYGGVGTIYAELTNTCGSNEEQMIFYVEDEFLLSITPNPTNGETTLTITERPTAETTLKSASSMGTFNEKVEWKLEVYDSFQNLKLKKQKLKGNSTTIQTASWKEGIYMVRVNYKEEVLSGKLVVKK